MTVLLALTIVSVVRITQLALREKGSPDLRIFWLAGHLIRQGYNPYQIPEQATLSRLAESIGDQVEILQILAQRQISPAAYTPPFQLLVIPLTWLPWPAVKTVWLGCNLLLMAITPWILFATPFFQPVKIAGWWRAMGALVFYNLLATKLAIEAGQSVILILFLMVGALASIDRQPLLAGVLLGFALSKYSVSIPLFLFFLLLRRWRVLLMAIMIQAAGFVVLSWLIGIAPWQLARDYVSLISSAYLSRSMNYGFTIQLASLFTPDSPIASTLSVLLTLIVIVIIGRLWLNSQGLENRLPVQFAAFTSLTIWSLLVIYHGDYDFVLSIFFLFFLIFALHTPYRWRLTGQQYNTLFVLLVVWIFVSTSLYTRSFYLVFPSAPDITPRTMTFSLIGMFVVTMWLGHRVVIRSLHPTLQSTI